MLTSLDPATLPRNVVALRDVLLAREAEHEAERERQASALEAAGEGLKAQVWRNEQLKLRLAKLLRERFGASAEKLRSAIEQLELLLDGIEEQIAETTPAEPEPPAAPTASETTRRKPARKPVRKPVPEALPRDVVQQAAPLRLSAMRRRVAPARRGRDRGAGLRAGRVPRHPPRAAEAVVPQLREHCPSASP
jgi:Transposase C of IS166 homeodomain